MSERGVHVGLTMEFFPIRAGFFVRLDFDSNSLRGWSVGDAMNVDQCSGASLRQQGPGGGSADCSIEHRRCTRDGRSGGAASDTEGGRAEPNSERRDAGVCVRRRSVLADL